MKKVLPALVLTALLVAPVIAESKGGPPTEVPKIAEDPQALINLLKKIGNWLFAILLAVAVVMLVVSGFLFVTAAGTPEKIEKARTILIYALIGVAIALAARGLVAVVVGILGGKMIG